jgi:flagellar basal body P-ring protein FlgI
MYRVIISNVYCPPERASLYQNQDDALRFANGKIIEDEDPYFQSENQVKNELKTKSFESFGADILSTMNEQIEMAKLQVFKDQKAKLFELHQIYQVEVENRRGETVTEREIEQTFG